MAPTPVAIKIMDMIDIQSFVREALVLQHLSGSPFVVPLYGACVIDQQLVVVMELMEVRKGVVRCPPLPVWGWSELRHRPVTTTRLFHAGRRPQQCTRSGQRGRAALAAPWAADCTGHCRWPGLPARQQRDAQVGAGS